MGRESAREKAKRLLGEGRVCMRTLQDDLILADVRGDSAKRYQVSWQPSGWACPCDALGICSHIRAIMLIVLEGVA